MNQVWKKEIIEWLRTTIITFIVIFLLPSYFFQPYKVQMSSMQPTLHNNDRIVVNKFIYRIAEPKRGDIVVFTPPMVDSKTRYIKRIVGLPGESVQIREGKVYINRIELIEPYLSQIETPGIVGPVVLEADEFFVLGDHRNNSMDSRDFGPVNKDLIYGKTMFILWPVKDFHVFGKEKYEPFEEQSTSFKKDQPPVPLV